MATPVRSRSARIEGLCRGIDVLPLNLALVGPGGRLLHMNPAMRERLRAAQRPPRDFLATFLESSLPADPADRADRACAAWRRALLEGASFSCLAQLADARWWRLSAWPAGARCHLIELIDVHELKTRALELEAAHARKDDIIAVLAHELRNSLQPLAHGLVLLHTLSAPAAEASRTHELMRHQLERLRRLVDDLMDVSQLQRDRLELRLEIVELGELLRQAVASVAAQAAEGDHLIGVVLPEAPARARVDPTRLVQVLVNLLMNACKYSPAGAPVQLRLERTAQELLIRVIDAGIGIEPGELDHIFDRYVRLDATRSRRGLGLGLWVARELIERQGGRIEAHSEGPGRGSEFRLRLPPVA